MPSTKSKDDTWTTDELTRALKRDERDPKRREKLRGEINGDDSRRRRKHEEEGKRERRPKDEDRRSRTRKHDSDDDEKPRLTEEERERLRQERRDKKDKKGKSQDREDKSPSKRRGDDDERQRRQRNDDDDRRRPRDDDDRRHKEKSRPREEDDDRRRHREGDDDRRRHRDGDDKRKHREDDDRRKHRNDDDKRKHRDEDDRRRRHRDEEDDKRRHKRDDDARRKHDDDDDRDKRSRHKDDDRRKRRDEDSDKVNKRHRRHQSRSDERVELDEDERERLRRERREQKEKQQSKDHKRKENESERKHKEKDRSERKRRDKDVSDEEDEKPQRYEEPRMQKQEKSSRNYNHHEETKEKAEAENEYVDYEDDFEDYEDDFEDDDDSKQKKSKEKDVLRMESASRAGYINRWDLNDQNTRNEMDEVLKALDEENDRLIAGSRRSDDSSEREPSDQYNDYRSESPAPTVERSRTVINFFSAKQRAMTRKANTKTQKRANDLLQMIELDIARYDMFDLPPVKEYDLYIRSFGRTNARQAYVQTNEDNLEQEVQTEEIETSQRWTQHPPEDVKGCGKGDGDDEEEVMQRTEPENLARMSQLLEKSAQTIIILLEEDQKEDGDDGVNSSDRKKANISISQGFTQLKTPSILEGQSVIYATFSPTHQNTLLTVHSRNPQAESNTTINKGIVCLWNTYDPSSPQKILACESQPTCCCLSPFQPFLAFAGLIDGSVAVWDLRESSSLHKSVMIDDNKYCLRFPSYNTAGVLDNDNHHSPVTTILPLVSSESLKLGDKHTEDLGSGLSFQLASIEQAAVINFWVVAEINSSDTAGSETDLGLSPGSRIKLHKTSSIVLSSPLKDSRLESSLRAFQMHMLPNDLNQYYVGTDGGYVLHGIRFGSRVQPKAHYSLIDTPVDVSCIDFSQFNDNCFLAGSTDGCLRLFHTKKEKPLVSWPLLTAGKPIKCVKWSKSRPCVFYVIDEDSCIYVFDVIEGGDAIPILKENISSGRITAMELTTDYKVANIGMSGSQPQMLLAMDNGKTEIHTLIKQFTEPQTLEQEFLQSFLDRF